MRLADVILIDDDQFVRTALSAGLTAYGINTLNTFGNASEAVGYIKSHKVDVAVVDLDLGPGPDGIDICRLLRETQPNIGLVMLTSFSDPRIWQPDAAPLPRGCRFVTKSNLSDFSKLVTEVLSARKTPNEKINYNIKRDDLLTSAQLEVLKMVAMGMSSNEIAAQRDVSVKAIEGMISKIYQEMELNRDKSLNPRVQLARAYMKLSGKTPPGA
jgi:two-component system invasion response regulator UvrY